MAKTRIAVIGAGAFGGWTALRLAERGADVTLIEAWGPGHSRSSSGGETRIIRATYGPSAVYSRMAVDSLRIWREREALWARHLFSKTGVLWLAGEKDDFERAALAILRNLDVAHEQFPTSEAARRWPQINFDGVKYIIYERDSGYLFARDACAAVVEAFVRAGGHYRQAHVVPGLIGSRGMAGVILNGSEGLSSDQYVFACGSWLPQLFRILAPVITPTRQEVFFFGTPAGDPRLTDEQLPVWIDNSSARLFYGIPGNRWRGLKLGDDTRGAVVDPTTEERRVSSAGIAAARAYLEMRFPLMTNAPLVESRVCQYEETADRNFVIDRHPDASNVWIVGGGSGHGFKHGPAVGDIVADAIMSARLPSPEFAIARFGLKVQ